MPRAHTQLSTVNEYSDPEVAAPETDSKHISYWFTDRIDFHKELV